MQLMPVGQKKCAEVMRKIFTAIIFIALAFGADAQDAELNKLTDIVISLKTGGEKAYKNAVSKLASDRLWTPMDELGVNKEVECRASERTPGFKLNSILTNSENAQRYQTTTGNHLNGADSRFSYSLFEKTLKAEKSTTYNLNERWGDQTIIIIPYSGKVAATATSGGKQFVSSSMGEGAIKLTGKAEKGKPLEISIRNVGSDNVSYVIINYNSRK